MCADFKHTGSQWLELILNWIVKANEPVDLVQQENLPRMRDFLESIGSNRRLAVGQLHMDLPHPWDSLAALRMGAQRRRSIGTILFLSEH